MTQRTTDLVLGGYGQDGAGGLGRVGLADDGFGAPEPVDGPDGPSWVVRASGPDETTGAGQVIVHAVEESANAVVTVRAGEGVVARAEAGGDAPCHLAVSPDGSWLVASCYVGGSVDLLAVGAGDAPTATLERVDTLRFDAAEHGPHERQDAPHAHQATFVSATEVLVCDLGCDRVRRVAVESGDATDRQGRNGDTPASAPRLRHTGDIELPPGTGPRHLALHPSRDDLLWVVGELDLAVHTLRREGGTWTRTGSTTTIPDGRAPGENTAAGIVIAPDASHVYVSTRGTDTVSVYAADEDGALTLRQQVATDHWPRFIGWVPGREGEQLLVAAERAGTVTVWEVDEGLLTETGHGIDWPGVTWVG